YHFELTIHVAGLRAEDIGAELVLAQQIEYGQSINVVATIELSHVRTNGDLETYTLDYTPDRTGSFDVALRIFPKNAHLPHRMDFALVKWA
ncbi:MAG: hypothetical protein RR752_05830, partial [Mucinivorans sp.]